MYFEVLVCGPLLSEDEREVLKWGHNAKVGHNAPKRLTHGKQLDTYKKATALECLVSFPCSLRSRQSSCSVSLVQDQVAVYFCSQAITDGPTRNPRL